MSKRVTPLLHRDNPDKGPLVGHVKVTREDWMNVARDVLVSEGVAEVKVLALGERLDVSRSSFYWYFKSRKHLLEALLDEWEAQNTQNLMNACDLPAHSIGEAVCNLFRAFIDHSKFDRGLDFAVREWARRDGTVRSRIDDADRDRLLAIDAMFQRHGFSKYDADARARILYYMQLGYHALEVREPMETRMSRLEGYIRGFTGEEPNSQIISDFRDFALSQEME
ncbi:TetR/AcrR family transcriptional regulator [Amylibacter sp. SFDW26]|uniref:TetR/AcrR family transcriptional regulator n=1 Tax=Amylibacter sp. SFDW26 TaxID=2652722 RepID=UPI0012618C09|nr:TetR/AcrR family transcriptional regulator [Amylibacter sp. SFDW26]KAB7613516.1 TetR/AcrR family transcriptional regulator [Amylibacter sp. SFDW26]